MSLFVLFGYIVRTCITEVFNPKKIRSVTFKRKKITKSHIVTRGADKSLVRPGRKQATATNLEIYST